ncbi:CDP-glycerol:glycerophosphate glycerophosphotransferase [Microbispora hainanensis]|uniref:bifunctional glycosyltransferase/CDP-glycerol:glycerophosphate glycerophosphotransferase n=1 Tax=Microbispora hainanensis TaxID=568844 RepID=UPI002E2DCB8D|nr:glycosyltransferase [Microbispora hainanensis]
MPRLSVIIPIYDVEPYLAGCLASVAAQTWQDIEVVMVDDGSPDGSAEIAAGFAARDDRFRLIRQANAGLGAARNTGVRHATGEHLMFLDSDDLLPAHALECLLASLERTGSDLATGNVLRLDGRGPRQSALHRSVFADAAAATHITRTHALLRDRLVTNKLWRRSFWDAHGFAFPEGVLYEDIAVALRAHFLARAVDVLPTPVYLWRRREDGGRSITQDKTRVPHLEDRFAAVTEVRRFLSEHNFTAHIHAWDHAVLDGDLTNFLDVLDQATPAFRERFLDLACLYLEDVAPPVLDGLPALRRVQWHLVRLRRMDDLLDVLAWDREVPPDHRLVRRMGGHHLNVPLTRSADREMPAAVTRARDELVPRHRIDAVRWEDGALVVEGRAAPSHLRPTRRVHQQVFATLVHERTGRRVRVPASVTRAQVSTKSKARDWGGFRLVIDPAALARPGRLGRWHVELRVLHRGVLRRGRLTDPGAAASTVEQAGYRTVGSDHYVAPLLGETGVLVLRAERETARVVTRDVRDGRLRLVGHVVNDLGPSPVLQVTRRPGGVPRTYPVHVDRRTFETAVDLRDLLPACPAPRIAVPDEVAAPEAWWEIEVRAADGTVTPVTLAEDVPTGRYGLAGREIVVTRDRTGGLVLRDQPAAAYADLAEWLPARCGGGGELLIEGGLTVPHEMSALVVTALDHGAHSTPRRGEWLLPIEGAGTRFRARLTPEQVASPAGRLPLPRGRYALAIRARTAGGEWTDLPLEFDTDLPAAHQTARRTFGVVTSGPGRAVLTVSGDLTADERGRKAQRALRTRTYPQMRERPLRDAVLFDGGAGTRFGGSPRAVCEELRRRGADLPLLWNVRDGQVALPGDVESVRTLGREHYEALARCRYVVTDAPLPPWFERRPGQVVVQTWQQPACTPKEPSGRSGAGQWTHLVSAGPWWTPLLRRTFDYEGEVLETGVPGDDLLTGPGAWERAADVRRRLGLPAHVRVLLYVAGEHDTLDAGRLAARLPEGHVLLVRQSPSGSTRPAAVGFASASTGLARHGGAVPGCGGPGTDGARLWDVGGHPDPHELYLAADVLIAGDAAAVVDFAVTRRPVLLHAGRPRDLWFLPEAPGPVLRHEGAVLDALAHLDEVTDKHRDAYTAFLARYRPMADGQAARRVVDALFG